MKQTDTTDRVATERANGAQRVMERPTLQPTTARAEFELRAPLSELEWQWLVAFLLSTGSVQGAVYLTGNSPRVVVKYDNASLDGLALVDLFYLCGVCPK